MQFNEAAEYVRREAQRAEAFIEVAKLFDQMTNLTQLESELKIKATKARKDAESAQSEVEGLRKEAAELKRVIANQHSETDTRVTRMVQDAEAKARAVGEAAEKAAADKREAAKAEVAAILKRGGAESNTLLHKQASIRSEYAILQAAVKVERDTLKALETKISEAKADAQRRFGVTA